MHRVRSDVPAGTALAMMLTVLSTAVVAAPSASPATPSSDSLQLRGTLPASDETPSQPAASEHLETKAPDTAQAAPAETGPGAATAPAAATDPIAVALRELIGSKQFEQLIARKSDRDAIATLYQKTRDFQPLWVDAEARPSAREDRHRLSAHGRRRRPRSAGLSDAELCRRRAGASRGRYRIHRDAVDATRATP